MQTPGVSNVWYPDAGSLAATVADVHGICGMALARSMPPSAKLPATGLGRSSVNGVAVA